MLKVQCKVTYYVTQCPRSLTDTAENWSPRMSWAAVAQASLRLTQEGFSRSSRERPSTDSPGKQLGSERPGVSDLRIKPELYLLGSLCLHLWKPSHASLMCVCVCARAHVRACKGGVMRREREAQVSLCIQSIFQRLGWGLGGDRTQEQECNCRGALRYCWP